MEEGVHVLRHLQPRNSRLLFLELHISTYHQEFHVRSLERTVSMNGFQLRAPNTGTTVNVTVSKGQLFALGPLLHSRSSPEQSRAPARAPAY